MNKQSTPRYFPYIFALLGVLSLFASMALLGKWLRAFVYFILEIACFALPNGLALLYPATAPWLLMISLTLLKSIGVVDTFLTARKLKTPDLLIKNLLWALIPPAFFAMVGSYLWSTMYLLNISGASMEPVILKGDYLIAQKLVLLWSPKVIPQRGRLMVLRHPQHPQTLLVKRIIGLPGDEIEYSAAFLKINGKTIPQIPTAQPLAKDQDQTRLLIETLDNHRYAVQDYPSKRGPVWEIKVPPGAYFVLGDNRPVSLDSRVFGVVPENDLVAHPLYVWWSLEQQFDETEIRWHRMGIDLQNK